MWNPEDSSLIWVLLSMASSLLLDSLLLLPPMLDLDPQSECRARNHSNQNAQEAQARGEKLSDSVPHRARNAPWRVGTVVLLTALLGSALPEGVYACLLCLCYGNSCITHARYPPALKPMSDLVRYEVWADPANDFLRRLQFPPLGYGRLSAKRNRQAFHHLPPFAWLRQEGLLDLLL